MRLDVKMLRRAKRMLSDVPVSLWQARGHPNEFTNGLNQCDAYGHLYRIESSRPNVFKFKVDKEADHVKGSVFEYMYNEVPWVSVINDRPIGPYSEKNEAMLRKYREIDEPKERVLAYLTDLIRENRKR